MRRFALVPLLAALVVAAGCGGSDNGGSSSGTTGGGAATGATATGTGTGTATAASSGARKVAYVSPVAAQPGQQDIQRGIEIAADELGWTASVLDANLSPDKQVAAVDTAVTQKLDAISSWSLDAQALSGAYERAMAAGMPVIGLNTEGEKVTGTAWNEHLLCGPGGVEERMAKLIADRVPGARTVIMTGPPAPSIVSMTKCFTAAAKKAGLDIVEETANTADTADASQRIMDDILIKHPDVQAIWNYNDQSALGDAAALAAAGKDIATADKDGIILIGHNGDADALSAVKDGRLTATWDPNYLATGLALAKLMQAGIADGADKPQPRLVVKGDLWTSENVADYQPPAERKYTLDSFPLVDEGTG
jgi:ribose transport system substrate-binding protein